MQDILGSIEVGVENNSTCLASEDRALPDQKIAIFADGCYWHNCKDCRYGKARLEKEKNDKMTNVYLQSQGWLVLRYWEHEILANPEGVVDEIEECLMERMPEKMLRCL
jgi:very-short-patch-repair endonuclease